MKLKKIVLRNFRSYRGSYEIPVDSLTAFVGKNDAGKSSVMEAMAIFFEHPSVKIEAGDLSLLAEEKVIEISCEFTDLPASIVVDKTAVTSLSDERLLNQDGCLFIVKRFGANAAKPKAEVFAEAIHPVHKGKGAKKAIPLIQFKNEQLKDLVSSLGLENIEVDKRSNVELRNAIRESGKLTEAKVLIPLDEADTKGIWDQINQHLPTFALFKSDRASTDEDAEIQDPMKTAVSIALREVQQQIEDIKRVVQERTLEVARQTVEKLRDIDPKLARELNPGFKADPKWDGIFKLSLTDENAIPLNKRGSGVRRLVLLSFFRSEAERRRQLDEKSHVIYAIEEPETSQHPDNQMMIIEALKDLAEDGRSQIFLTTHVPALASLLPTRSIRYIRNTDDGKEILFDENAIFASISADLGVLPDARVKVIVCVEGKHDVSALRHFGKLIRQRDPNIVCLEADPRILLLPLGGGTLRDWVNENYLKNLGRPEIHIYDRDEDRKYQNVIAEVNARTDGSRGFLTTKREMENYFHQDAIFEATNLNIEVDDTSSISALVAQARHQESGEGDWAQLDSEKRDKKISQAKRNLNTNAIYKMELRHLDERDPAGEIAGWLQSITRLL